MRQLFRQNSIVSCFYCQSTITPLPRNPRSFQCPHCDCWNRYDVHGDIISDEPAMYDEKLNSRSFAKRASPRKDRLPTMYGTGLFCHTCQTNQTLLTNLLSSYLPATDDPDYQKRLDMLPDYRRSIEKRYPPICADCSPAVEEEIQKRDQMARTRALGGFLHASNGIRRQAAQTPRETDKLLREMIVWKIRGVLWVSCLLTVIAGHLSVACGHPLFRLPVIIRPAMPAITALSLLWSAWNPTYSSFRKAQFQGRTVRMRGKRQYNILQSIAWLSRFIVSSTLALPRQESPFYRLRIWDDPDSPRARLYSTIFLTIELIIFVWSFCVLRLERPPPVRLATDPTEVNQRLTSPSPPPPSQGTSRIVEPDLLAPLTLSSRPVLQPPAVISVSKPVFGVPSLTADPHSDPAPNASMDIEDDDESSSVKDPDAMDWSPIRPSTSSHRNSHISDGRSLNDGPWLRPQRFFPPEEPTGLENLFADTVRLADDNDINRQHQVAPHSSARGGSQGRQPRWAKHWLWRSALCLIPVASLIAGYRILTSRSRYRIVEPDIS